MKNIVTFKKPLWRKIAFSLIALIILVSISLTLLANHLVNYAISRNGAGGKRNVSQKTTTEVTTLAKEKAKAKDTATTEASDLARKKIALHKQQYKEAVSLFLQTHKEELASIQSKDNLRLTAYYFTQNNSAKWVILVHGYRSNHKSMYDYALEYYKQGYNVLVPEQRAVLNSEGDYIGMGFLEKEDMQAWIKWILTKDEKASIVLHGNSMGAATVLMLSGDTTCEQVKAFIADSSYTSVWDIFASELKLRFHLPEFPLMHLADMIAKHKAGYSFSEASCVKQVAKATKPIMFIHGKKDNFVPYAMLEQLVKAKTSGTKTVLSAPNAGHVEALYDLGATYFKTVFAFLEKVA